MSKPNRKNFQLSKIKLNKSGGLIANFDLTEADGDNVDVKDYQVESHTVIHPDLKGLIESLRPIVARVYNFGMITTLIESKEFKGTKAQTKAGRKLYEELQSRIRITGVSLSGENDNIGVVITSGYEVQNKQVQAINTPKIRFSTSSFGFEEELEEIIGEIEEETFQYIFEGKKAALELFGANGQATKEASNGTEETSDDEETEGEGIISVDGETNVNPFDDEEDF